MYRRQRMKHPLSKWTATAKYALVLLAASAALAGCSLLPRETEVLQPPLVEPAQEQFDVVPVSRGDIQTSLRGTAYFVSSNAVPLSFKESGGRVKAIAVTAGQEVKAGDLLVELETGDLDFQIRMQRLNVERTTLLYRQALTSGASSTDTRLRQIDLEREQMSLDAMQNRLDKSRLFAPISGTVTFVENLNAGDTVNAYQSIVTIADPSDLKLTYVAADSKELFAVKAGMPVGLKYKGANYTGKVVQSPSNIPAAADSKKAENNAVTVIMSMDNPPDGIHVGDSADLTIELQKRVNVIILPRSALRSYMGRSYVQIADGDRRKEVDIEVGLTTPTAAEIVTGLEEGQQVILSN